MNPNLVLQEVHKLAREGSMKYKLPHPIVAVKRLFMLLEENANQPGRVFKHHIEMNTRRCQMFDDKEFQSERHFAVHTSTLSHIATTPQLRSRTKNSSKHAGWHDRESQAVPKNPRAFKVLDVSLSADAKQSSVEQHCLYSECMFANQIRRHLRNFIPSPLSNQTPPPKLNLEIQKPPLTKDYHPNSSIRTTKQNSLTHKFLSLTP